MIREIQFLLNIRNETFVWRTGASICDSDGNLLFYTNGFRIYNRNFEIMQNGNNLNIGDFGASGYNALPVPDGAVIIPFVNSPNKYYVFHTDLNFVFDSTLGNVLFASNLFYDVVDILIMEV